MALGAGAAQLIGWMAMPVLTRIYSPEEWGVAGFIISAGSLCAIFSCLRYEIAILLPKTNKQATHILRLCLTLSMSIFLINMVFAYFFWANQFLFPLKIGLGSWCFAIPILGVLICWVNVFTNVLIREERFKKLSLAIAVQQIMNVFIAIVLSIFTLNFASLVISRALSSLSSLFLLTHRLSKPQINSLDKKMTLVFFAIAKRYRRFPIYSLPNSILSLASKDGILLVIGLISGSSTLGMLVLARTMIFSPASLLSSVLGPVFLREFSTNLRLKQKNDKALLTAVALFSLFLPIYILAGWHSQILISFIFGSIWEEADYIFVALLPAGFLLLFNSWFDRIFEIRQKTNLVLFLQMFFDVLMLLTIILLGINQFELPIIIYSYSTILFIHNFIYLLLASFLILKKHH